jgi:hypothetical protein
MTERVADTAVRGAHRRLPLSPSAGLAPSDLASRRLVAALILLVILGLGLHVSTAEPESFAAFHTIQRIVLPVAYAMFAAACLLPAMSRRPVQVPAWVWLPAAGTGIGLFVNAYLVGGSGPTDALLQNVVLFCGFAMLGWFGLQAATWSERTLRRLLGTLLLAALAAGALGVLGFVPFLALGVPGFFAAVVLALRGPRNRVRYLVLCGVLGVMMLINLQPNPTLPIQVAVLAQVALCSAVLALVLLVPRRLRAGTIAVGAGAAIYVFVQLGGLNLLMGQYSSDDVTVAHRSYEANLVLDRVADSPWTILFGYGPGGTVDLSGAPDAATLELAGRDLTTIDDVHLLTAHLLFKMGILGLVWLAVLLAAVWRTVISCVVSTDVTGTYRLALLMFLVAGIADALPAATHLLSNLLVPLLLGMLCASDRGKQLRPGG